MDQLLTPEMLEKYGLGGLAILLIFWGVVYYIKKLKPELENIKKSNENVCDSLDKTNNSIERGNSDMRAFLETINLTMKNNTSAITEVSRANDNVANAISLLDNTLKNVQEKVDKIDSIYTEVVKIDERTKMCPRQSYKGDN